MPEGKAKFIAVANGAYVLLPALSRAVPDAEDLAKILLSRHGFETTVLPSLERGALLDEIDQHLRKGALVDGALIVVWIGHGKVGADNTLRLLGLSKSDDVEVASASDLGEWAARTGAQQVLLVIDTCFSGAGVVDAARLADAVNSGRTSPEKVWFGVVAASLRDEPARSGALVRELIRVLSEGPNQADFRWDRTRPFISGVDLLQALTVDWNEPRQRPCVISVGRTWDLVRNPRFVPGVPDQPVEHLRLAARGGSGEESYFTGREFALRAIVKWVRSGVPGLFVLTGPPGCGKSAIAGRIACLSSSIERERLLATTPIPSELDPGAGSVDGQLQVRGVTADTASEQLARQLGLDAGAGPFGVLAEARRRRKGGDPLFVVIDGLDEARTFSSDLAVELVAPLAREALVLVATRDVPLGEKTLIATLGPAAQVLDLGKDIGGTRQDVRNYVKRRLAGVGGQMNPELVADELASSDASKTPQFLLARLVTSQLREHPVDTSCEGWRLALATTVESALERDLQSLVLTIAGKPHPTAARELIYALALAHGGGFPADDVWPMVATAVSPTGTVYNRDDAYAVLEALGRHLVAGSEGEQPVYRIAHQRLVDYLKGAATAEAGAAKSIRTASAVGEAILALYAQLLDAGLPPRAHTYLWRYAWRHLAEARPEGFVGLRRLTDRDPAAFLPDLAAALELAASEALSVGLTDQALGWIREAIEVRRKLTDKLGLAMALFRLAFIQAAAGETSGADEAAAEASKVAREVADRPESRKVLSSVLFARAATQLLDGHYTAARFLAKEAVTLLETSTAAVEQGTWFQLAAAYGLAGRAAFAQQDLASASTACQKAVDLIDKQLGQSDGRDLRTEALSVLAAIELVRAVSSPPDSTGSYCPSVTPAADRMLEEFKKAGKQGTLGDIPVSRGLLCYVRARSVDLSRGLTVPGEQGLISLLNDAISLARPLADQVLDAALAFVDELCLQLLAQCAADASVAASDRARAEKSLRRFANTNSLAAFALGQLLDAETVTQLPRVMQGTIPDLSSLIARQKEAVAMLRKCSAWFARHPLAQALSRLSGLLAQPGAATSDQDLPTRAEAIEAWRKLSGLVPDAPIQLVELLSDQAARLLRGRTNEAAELASEAVALAEKLPQPQFAGLAGIAETNLAAAQLMLGGRPDLRALLQRAIDHLNPLVPHPLFSGVLATACMNLSHVEIDDGHFAEALPLAERAVALFGEPNLLPIATENRPLASLVLGRAQRGTGLSAVGTQTLRDAIASLRSAALDSERNCYLLAHALNVAAPEFWDEVLADLVDKPNVHRLLSLQRWRSPDQIRATVDTVLQALTALPSTQHRSVRAIARQQRSRAPKEFDAAWQEAGGAIPPWLELKPEQESLVIGWWNAPSWTLSRDYLKAHIPILDPGTDIVLDEFEMEGIDAGILARYRQLLAAARSVGPDAGYAPLLAVMEVAAWVNSSDPESHFAEYGELLRPEIREVLQEEARKGDPSSGAFAAVLDLAQRGESQLAFQATKDPGSMTDHLRAAWRSKDATRLASLATIVQGWTKDSEVWRTATAALAVARVLEQVAEEPDRLIAAALDGSANSEREKMLAVIGDAIQYHPSSAPELARLLQQVANPEAGLSDPP